MAHRLFRPSAVLILSCVLFGSTHAAELGEPRVSSYIGQQLVADVELTTLENAASPVQARLASADVYRGANIAMPPVLSGLHLSVMRREGRQFLHLTTLRPVDADHLHVYLELADGSQRTVRLATLWLTPDPNPAPPAPVVASAPAAPLVAADPAPAAAVPARAPAAAPPAARRTPAPAHAKPALAKPSPAQATPTDAKPASTDAKPAPARPRPVGWAAPLPTRSSTPKPPSASPAAMRPEAPHDTPAALHASAPPACPPPAAPTQASACLALDGKNAALRAEVGQLENKVRALQAAISDSRAAPPASRPSAAPLPAKPSAQRPVARRPVRPKLPPKDEGWPTWIWLAAAGTLAAAGAGLFAWRRARSPKSKKKKQMNKPEMEVVVSPRVMGGVKSRLMTEQAEPSLE